MTEDSGASDTPTRLRAASGLIASGDFSAAAEIAAQVLIGAPDHPGAHALAGMAALSLERGSDAVRHLTVAAKRLAGNAAIQGNLATALRRNGSSLEALLPQRRALLLDPKSAGATLTLAQTLSDLGEPLASERSHARAAVLDPTNPEIWYNLGVLRLQLGRLERAAQAYRPHARLLHGRPGNQGAADPMPSLPAEPVRPVSRLCCLHRLAHDRDQLNHLRDMGLLPRDMDDEPERYQALIDGLSEEERGAISFQLDGRRYLTIARSWNRYVYLEQTGWTPERPALNPNLDWSGLESGFLGGDPRCLAIDGLVTDEALEALRRICRNSTFWHQIKGAGYLGAYLREGFSDPLILAIAHQLRDRLPGILGDQPVRMIWAYSYDQGMVGINPHADFAGVNMNFWITPDAANLNAETGGLVVYRKAAPEDWDFRTYNTASTEFIYDFLGDDRDDFVRIPHRANRAALFDSRLIHETDRADFAPGFLNRRINITMLFGDGGA